MTRLAQLRSLPRPWKLAGAAILAVPILSLVALSQCGPSDPDDPMPVASVTVQAIANTPCMEEGCHRWMIYDAEAGWWYGFSATVDQAQTLDAAGFEVRSLPDEPTVAQESAGGDGSVSTGTFLRRYWWAFPLIVGFWVFGRYGLGRKPGPSQ